MVASGQVEVRSYPRDPLHAKAYLCWYANHAEPGAAIVGSSNFTLAGFTGNTELNVRVTGDAEMEALRDWFESLWKDSADVSQALLTQLNRSWALALTPPYHVYLKALHELYYTQFEGAQLPLPQRVEQLANFPDRRRQPRAGHDRRPTTAATSVTSSAWARPTLAPNSCASYASATRTTVRR